MTKPYKAEERGAYWICVDARSGQIASYPTTKSQARAEARFMNAEYARAVREVA